MYKNLTTEEVTGNAPHGIIAIVTTMNACIAAMRDYVASQSEDGMGRPEEDHAIVSLTKAATISGYSTRQLSRLIHQRRIPNYGSQTRPKVAVGDLPRKAGMARSA